MLEDLRRRLAQTNRVHLPLGTGWDRGTEADYLADVVSYWADTYKWPEARIQALPWATVTLGDTNVRLLHQKAAGSHTTVALLHGWPDSVLRFERVLPLLADVNVVVPCLPGFPFAPALTTTGMSTTRMAELFVEAMATLGYDRYVVSGGDVGGSIAEAMATKAPDSVTSLHLTDIPLRHLQTLDHGDLSVDEQAYSDTVAKWQRSEGAYGHQQSTKPHTLAAALGDSPAGLLAWIVEKLRSWSDCGGDVESAFPRDDLLTWVTAYWVTGAIGTSFSPYFEPREPITPLSLPTAVTLFPHDLLQPPRSFGERFLNIQAWDIQPRGGHFAAWEAPDLFVAGVRSAVALQR